jgi:hypothetical protein
MQLFDGPNKGGSCYCDKDSYPIYYSDGTFDCSFKYEKVSRNVLIYKKKL